MDPQPRRILTVSELIQPRSAPPPREKTYSAPRRFDLATLLVIMVAYAILLAGMKALKFDLIAFAMIASFITVIGLAQIILPQGQPRKVSIITGAVLCVLAWLGTVFWTDDFIGNPAIVVMLIVLTAWVGAISGYLAGALVGGVFLVADVLRRRYVRYLEPLNQNSGRDG